MRGDWIVTIGVLVIAAVAYALTWRSARERLARNAMRRLHSIPARRIMSRPVVIVGEDATVADAAKLMLEHSIGCLPVVGRGGRMIGLVTESDLSGARPFIRAREQAMAGGGPGGRGTEARNRPVHEVMTERPVTARPEEAVGEIADRMIERGIHHTPVVEEGIPVGIVARRDLLGLLTSDRA